MALEEIEIDVSPKADPPAEVVDWIDACETRIDDFFETEANKRYPLYLPSAALPFHHALAAVSDAGLAEGDRFCEWGSGFGVHAGVAALHGFESHGLEIEPELVSLARELAASSEVDVTYYETSYLPEGFEAAEGQGGTDLLPAPGRSPEDPGGIYEGTELISTEIDVFYIYPRPDDQEFMLELFDHVAIEGALLITWFGVGTPLVFRKEV